MSLAHEYARQAGWRDWQSVVAKLPALAGRRVLDLGCGVGDQARALAARGARVTAVDGNGELLAAARARRATGVEFVECDLRALADLGAPADGIWCSFVAAYFPDLRTQLAAWAHLLRPDGWIALTEIDDLFGHEPLAARARTALDAYVERAFAARRYDFRMGRRLRGHLESSGFRVEHELVVADAELSFDGPAAPDVLEAWERRFNRLRALRDDCGAAFEGVRDDFLACLAHPAHRSTARVVACVGRRG